MKVYLILSLYDNSAYVTEKVCLTEKIAERELIKLQKKSPNTSFKIEMEKVIK